MGSNPAAPIRHSRHESGPPNYSAGLRLVNGHKNGHTVLEVTLSEVPNGPAEVQLGIGGGFLLNPRHEAAVVLHGRGHIAVTKPVRDHLQRRTGDDQRRGVGVADAVVGEPLGEFQAVGQPAGGQVNVGAPQVNVQNRRQSKSAVALRVRSE